MELRPLFHPQRRRVPVAPRGRSQFPSLLYSVTFSCLLLEGVHSVFSCLTGVIATYIHVYLISLIARGDFSVVLLPFHLVPLIFAFIFITF